MRVCASSCPISYHKSIGGRSSSVTLTSRRSTGGPREARLVHVVDLARMVFAWWNPEEQGKKSRTGRGSVCNLARQSHRCGSFFVGFLIPVVNMQSLRWPVDGCGGARSRTLQVRMYCSISRVARHVLPAATLARSFLLHAVCARTFLFLSFANVSNNQTNSRAVSVGSIACVAVVHSMAFLSTPVRGNLRCNV